jgi:monoamine oxidase
MLLHEAGVEALELNGSQLCWSDGTFCACEGVLDHEFEWIEALKHWRGDDRSFSDYLDQSSVSGPTRLRLVDYVEGFNAADSRNIGVISLGEQQAAEDAIEGDRLFHVVGGYQQIPEFVAEALKRAGGRILLNTRVVAIEWGPSSVRIRCERDGQITQLSATKAIITLPLGVLLAEAVNFSPRPIKILEVAARLGVGSVQRTVLQFREPFWTKSSDTLADPLRKMSFLYSTGRIPSVWWTPFPDRHPWLIAWTGGPRASLLPQKRDELERLLLSELAHMFGQDRSAIEQLFVMSFMHDWQHDPLSLGAYSYATVNADHASEKMTEPLDGTLYFAGEHTDVTGHWGTVHGALRSGLRAASQILDS